MTLGISPGGRGISGLKRWSFVHVTFTFVIFLTIVIVMCSLAPISVVWIANLLFYVLFLKFAPNHWFETHHRREEVIEFFPAWSYTMTAEELYAGIERENNRERHVCQEAKNASDYVCLCVHGKVSHLKSKDPVRRAAVSLVGRGMSVSERSEEEKQRYYERATSFLADNRRGKRLTVVLELLTGDMEVTLDKLTSSSGHVSEHILVPYDKVASPVFNNLPEWVRFHSVPCDEQVESFRGECQILRKHGLSVISDIDDTIKDTNLANPKVCLERTFLKKFMAVEGMADLYSYWRDAGAQFHYVSSSPYQLWRYLKEFLEDEGFPRGSVNLRRVRVKDSSLLQLIRTPHNFKLLTIESLLASFPHRRFILVGDSGEFDPEIYATLADRYPMQVKGIFIRSVDEVKGKKPFRVPKNVLVADNEAIADRRGAVVFRKVEHNGEVDNTLRRTLTAILPAPHRSNSDIKLKINSIVDAEAEYTDDDGDDTDDGGKSEADEVLDGEKEHAQERGLPAVLVEGLVQEVAGKVAPGLAEAAESKGERLPQKEEQSKQNRWEKIQQALPSGVIFRVFEHPSDLKKFIF